MPNLNNNSNTTEFNFFDENDLKTDGRRKRTQPVNDKSKWSFLPFKPCKSKGKVVKKKRRGCWTTDRRMALLNTYCMARPHGVPHGSREAQWRLVTDKVNEHTTYDRDKDGRVNPPMSQKTVKKQFPKLIDTYRDIFPIFVKNKSLVRKQVHPSIELSAYRAWCVMKKDEAKSKDDKKVEKIRMDRKKEVLEKAKQLVIPGRNIQEGKGNIQQIQEDSESSSDSQQVVTIDMSSEDEDSGSEVVENEATSDTRHEQVMNALNTQTTKLANIESILTDIRSLLEREG